MTYELSETELNTIIITYILCITYNFPPKFLLKLTLGAATLFCLLMILFNENKNKKACSTNVMVR